MAPDLTDLNWTQKSFVHFPTAGVLRKSKKPQRYAIKKKPLYGSVLGFSIDAYAKEQRDEQK